MKHHTSHTSVSTFVHHNGDKIRVNIQRLKDFAVQRLPQNSPLRFLLLYERDQLDAYEFLAKMDLWLKLIDLLASEGGECEMHNGEKLCQQPIFSSKSRSELSFSRRELR